MKILIITDSDLDGSGCALALKWLYEHTHTIDIVELMGMEYGGLIKGLSKSFDEYEKVFITDSFVADDVVEYVDIPKVTIIDHHQDHIDLQDRYKNCEVIMELYPSCAKLIRDRFYDDTPISSSRDELLTIINDYDSYELKHKDTLRYNAIFNVYNRPKVNKFVEAFNDGVREFTSHEQNTIKIYQKHLREELIKASGSVHCGNIKDNKVICFFADKAINEVSHAMLKLYKADISIAIALSYKGVSFRRGDGISAKMNVLAEALCGGGGHEYSAGGAITDKLMSFVNTLTPCSR